MNNYSAQEEIRKFLEMHNIEYNTEYSNFCLWYNHPSKRRTYEIEYVHSLDYPVAYPKYGIEGVDKNYFFNLSYEAEQNNSFKLWIKDFEWKNERQREVIKSYILYAANKTPNKFYARECEIKEVSTKEARQFEEENCFYLPTMAASL
jgi:hypothetical protein